MASVLNWFEQWMKLRDSHEKSEEELLRISDALSNKNDEVQQLRKENQALKTEIDSLTTKNRGLKEEIRDLRIESLDIHLKNFTLQNAMKKFISKLKQKNRNCSVCMENPATHAAVPCGHQCVCEECSLKLQDCPLCRTRVERWIHIFQC